jgi:decaprenylphospho-beta-D-erythro-pentofuranosid-2-ulose 2-reductase
VNDALGRPRTAVVLGGGSDIGRSISLALAGAGTRTFVLTARDPSSLDGVAADLLAAGASTVERVALEATDLGAHEAAVEELFHRAGADVDLVVIAFGVLGDQSRDERSAPDAVEVAIVNYVAQVSVGTLVADRLRSQGHGAIVALSSVAAERPRRFNYVYGSSKAGMDAFFNGMGDALAGTGVHVLVVRPGFVKTKMTAHMKPAPLAVTAADVAAAVVTGLRERRSLVWVPPPVRAVMVVLRHLPRPLFRRIRS